MKALKLLVILFSSAIFASPVDQTFLKLLRTAKSAAQLDRIRTEHDQLQRDHRICRLQTSQKIVPSACYRWLRIQRAWQLLPEHQAEQMEQKFDGGCRSAVRDDLHSSENWLRVSPQELSVECARLVRRAVEIHRYRVGAEFEFENAL